VVVALGLAAGLRPVVFRAVVVRFEADVAVDAVAGFEADAAVEAVADFGAVARFGAAGFDAAAGFEAAAGLEAAAFGADDVPRLALVVLAVVEVVRFRVDGVFADVAPGAAAAAAVVDDRPLVAGLRVVVFGVVVVFRVVVLRVPLGVRRRLAAAEVPVERRRRVPARRGVTAPAARAAAEPTAVAAPPAADPTAFAASPAAAPTALAAPPAAAPADVAASPAASAVRLASRPMRSATLAAAASACLRRFDSVARAFASWASSLAIALAAFLSSASAPLDFAIRGTSCGARAETRRDLAPRDRRRGRPERDEWWQNGRHPARASRHGGTRRQHDVNVPPTPG
jgi:hypothetical protein